MLQKMFLDDKELHLAQSDLPCLISYPEKTGGSQFSVTLIADLFLRGEKVLFLTAYPMATDNFLSQIAETNRGVKRIDSENDIAEHLDADAIMIKSGDEDLFMKIVPLLPDLKQRIIFVKNIEKFSDETVKTVLAFEKIVLSGHLDECRLKEFIANYNYQTTIIFDQPTTGKFKVPKLEKYTGYLQSKSKKGVVRLDMND